MSDGFSVKVDIPDFRRQLAEVGRRIERRAVSQGVRNAARVFRDDARKRAPVLRDPTPRRVPGALRNAIVIARTRRKQRGLVGYSVIVRASKARRGGPRDPWYWRFLEGGWVARGPGQRLRGSASRKAERRASSGRQYQYPFLAPAFRASQGPALAAFARGVESRIAEAQAVR
jgi:HK97 gp10 family phage protein